MSEGIKTRLETLKDIIERLKEELQQSKTSALGAGIYVVTNVKTD